MSTETKKAYCYHTEEQIKASGLLSPDRMDEVTAEIDRRIEPCFDRQGRELKAAFIAECPEGRMLFASVDNDSQREYLRRSVLAGVLTQDEITLINGRALAEIDRRRDEAAFAKARKVEAWDGGAFLGDQYFSSMDDLCDHIESEGIEWPEYVWAAKPTTVISGLDVAGVVENQIDNHGWEDMDTNDLNGVHELQAALDKFCEANASVQAYWPDNSTAILLAAWKAA